MFTEEDSSVNWINRSVKDIKIKLPTNVDELAKMDNGYKFECFHNLDTDVNNAETKVLHHSAHLFSERPEVKNKLHLLIHNFAVLKDTSHLKIMLRSILIIVQQLKKRKIWNIWICREFLSVFLFKR